ncbi:hypothetical protein [Mesorhizobium sp. URHB0026]
MSQNPKHPARLWMSFADCGEFQPLHIRQWQSTPFDGGFEYVLSASQEAAAPSEEPVAPAPKIYGEEGEFVICWPGRITISISEGDAGYAFERDGKFIPGKYDIYGDPINAAQEISDAVAALASPAVAPVACKRCKGTGTVADYVGDDMRCVEVECDLCARKQP